MREGDCSNGGPMNLIRLNKALEERWIKTPRYNFFELNDHFVA